MTAELVPVSRYVQLPTVQLLPASWIGDRYRPPTFREYLVSIGLHPKTIYAYMQRLKMCEEVCRDIGAALETADAMVLAEIANRCTQSQSMLGQTRTALKHFYAWLDRRDPPLRAIRVPPQPALVVRSLDPDRARALVEVSIGRWPKGGAVMLGLYLALRRAEIAMATWERFDKGMEWYTVTGKGSKTCTIPVSPILAEYLAPHRSTGYLFPGRPEGHGLSMRQGKWRAQVYIGKDPAGRRRFIEKSFSDRESAEAWLGENRVRNRRGHVNPETVWEWIKQLGREAGIGEINTHQLRHTSLTQALDNTENLRSVMTFARHSDPDVTARYTRTTGEQLRGVADSLRF